MSQRYIYLCRYVSVTAASTSLMRTQTQLFALFNLFVTIRQFDIGAIKFDKRLGVTCFELIKIHLFKTKNLNNNLNELNDYIQTITNSLSGRVYVV